jgi:hypothetical protein
MTGLEESKFQKKGKKEEKNHSPEYPGLALSADTMMPVQMHTKSPLPTAPLITAHATLTLLCSQHLPC